MDAAYVSAFAALGGALIGGLTSFANLMAKPANSNQDAAALTQANPAGRIV
jgi:hypothetical protein